MEYTNLGQTGLKVSRLGFGGIPIQRNSTAEAIKIINRARELGINFYDSARGYGDSETKLGQALKGKRHQVILASKSMARTAAEMRRDIDLSLEQLQTDYIDLYQCHNVKEQESLDRILGPDGALEALVQARQAGKIRHIGISGHRPPVLLQALETGQFETFQFPFNYIEKEMAAELLERINRNGLGSIIMKPLAGGAFRQPVAALKFILGHNVSTVIPGMDSLEQVEMNLKAVETGTTLTEAEISSLEADARTLGKTFCRRCEYCQPCPAGIEISTVFLLDGYYERYGLPDWGRKRYRGLAIKADACQDCGQCEEKCPYSLPIRQLLAKAHSHLGTEEAGQ